MQIMSDIESSSSMDFTTLGGKKRKADANSHVSHLEVTVDSVNTNTAINQVQLGDILEMVKQNNQILVNLQQQVNDVASEVEIIKTNFITRDLPVADQLKIHDISEKVDKLVQSMEANKSSSHTLPMDEDSSGEVSLVDLIPNYEDKVKRRAQAYFNYLHNGDRFRINNEWYTRDEQFIPPKYVPKAFKYRESDRLYQVRKEEKLNTWRSDIEIYGIRRDEAKALVDNHDSEMLRLINELEANEGAKTKLFNDHNKRIEAEEEISRKNWQKRKENLENMPTWAEKHISKVDDRFYRSKSSDQTGSPDVNPTPEVSTSTSMSSGSSNSTSSNSSTGENVPSGNTLSRSSTGGNVSSERTWSKKSNKRKNKNKAQSGNFSSNSNNFSNIVITRDVSIPPPPLPLNNQFQALQSGSIPQNSFQANRKSVRWRKAK